MPTLVSTRDALLAAINAGGFPFVAVAAYVPIDADKPTAWVVSVEPWAAADTSNLSRGGLATVDQQFSVVLRNGIEKTDVAAMDAAITLVEDVRDYIRVTRLAVKARWVGTSQELLDRDMQGESDVFTSQLLVTYREIR